LINTNNKKHSYSSFFSFSHSSPVIHPGTTTTTATSSSSSFLHSSSLPSFPPLPSLPPFLLHSDSSFNGNNSLNRKIINPVDGDNNNNDNK
jgi:hypothetical protein